ncbi:MULTISPECIES: signal peptidase I [unclassified Moritella]|uniref:signal peptidase I n=1 Tax=unclassified Moritella TaxID=2637987 RepID=UPI001BAC2C60|nr:MULTISPECIES: signal peptidase I [unclassified Moritella]QUM86688.1 signal peptidase I [Moritella sp. 28]QUM90915.1 signal peptidase I [Moritella sp. 36]
MATYFSLILVLVTFVSGIIWALDKLIWEKARAEKVAFAQSQAELPAEAIAKLGQESFIVENAKSIFPVIAAVMVLRSFLYEPFQIPSGSMMPTLLVGDFILVEKFSYGVKDPVLRSTLIETGKPERGDVAVFKYPPEPTVDYIKRVVGLPGDRIAYRGKQVFIQQACSGTNCAGFKKLDLSLVEIGKFKDQMVELQQYTEQLGDVKHNILINPSRPDLVRDFYQQDNPPTRQYEWVVPDGHYFMMGDNRDNSADSRFWGFVPEANLVGKAVFIWTSFEFERDPDSLLPSWIPTGIRFSRIGKLK